jgi:FkbM family methyltransferase
LVLFFKKEHPSYMPELPTRYGPLQVPDPDHDMIARFLQRYGEWAWAEALFLASVTAEGANVLDAGAFVGTFGLGLALLRPVRVCFVEANPAMATLLSANVAANAPGDCVVVEAMLAAPGDAPRAGRADPGNLGAASFSPAQTPACNIPAPTQALSLAELRAAHGDFDLIKLDVEFMELAILRGDTAHLSQGRVTLWVECNEDPRSLELAALLLSWGLDLFYFAFPAHNPGNFNDNAEAVFPLAFEAGLLAAPRIPPVLGAELQAMGCMLKRVRSVEEVRRALWLTPRWGMEEWREAAGGYELAALAGRSLRGEIFDEFLQPGAPAPVRADAAGRQLASLERELARVSARGLSHLALCGALRERTAALEAELVAARAHAAAAEQALVVMRASRSWRMTAPIRKLSKTVLF